MVPRPLKRRKLTPPGSDQESSSYHAKTNIQTSFFKNAVSWDLEQDYELKARKGKQKGKESSRLPIKNAEGVLLQAGSTKDESDSVASDAERPDEDRSGVSSDGANGYFHEEPRILEREQILAAKEELAKVALRLNENPEENAGA